jgi:hypothetical protein
MNNDIADLAITAITDHPHSHNQHAWLRHTGCWPIGITVLRQDLEKSSCGTTACLAGWVAVLTASQDTCFYNGAGIVMVESGGVAAGIAAYAAGKLEITPEQADMLFLKLSNDEVVPGLKYLKDHPDATARDIYQEVASIRRARIARSRPQA